MPTVHGALLPEALATFLHKKEVTVWMMSCGALVSSPESYTQLEAEVEWQVTALVLPGEAESTIPFQTGLLQHWCHQHGKLPLTKAGKQFLEQ